MGKLVEPKGHWPRVIAHVDMDAFFAAVEMRDNPKLRNLPVAVGGSSQRGVISTANYQARKYGVRSAMSSVKAKHLCPELVLISGNHGHYRAVSAQIMEVLDTFTPIREAVSVDEAYLDLTGAQRRLGAPAEIAKQIRQAVWDKTKLTCSVGVGISKSVAKIASGYQKPYGITVVEPERTLEFLSPLPVGVINGIGPTARKKLDRLGVKTIQDLRELPISTMNSVFGSAAIAYLNLTRGIDSRPVGGGVKDKSIGKERTFEADISNRLELKQFALRLSDEVTHKLRNKGFLAKTVSLKIKAADFSTITRSSSFTHPTNSSTEFRNRIELLLEKASPSFKSARLLGVRAEHLALQSNSASQGLLDESAADWEKVDQAFDQAVNRFGLESLQRASNLPPHTAG